MEVREGYKKTEVGVIPEEWDSGDLSSLTSKIGSGITPTGGSRIYKNSGRPFVRSQNVLNAKMDLTDIVFIDEETHNTFRGTEIHNDDVLLNITGASIGRSSVADKTVIGGNVNQHVCILRPVNDKIISLFLSAYILSSKGQKYINDFQSGGNRQGLNFKQIASIKIPIPSLQEQQAIATALSNVDNLINSLTKLINKKKRIKQGAMQELLTGKKRLDGFSGEWDKKTIDEISVVSRGRVISQVEISKSLTKKYPVYSSQTLADGIMGYLDTYDFDGDYITWTTDGVNAGTVFYRRGRFNCTNVCGTIKLQNHSYYFISKRLGLETGKYVSKNLANPKLMNDVMKKITVTFPCIEEQTAIANILSDMDAEIEALENKLNKYKNIKQGMMQELLTGRIRLV